MQGYNKCYDNPCALPYKFPSNKPCNSMCEPKPIESMTVGLDYKAVDYKDRCLETDVIDLQNLRKGHYLL